MKKIKKFFKNWERKPQRFKYIGNNVQIHKSNKFIDPENISFGNNVYIGFEGLFIGHGGIQIDNGTIIAHRVEITTRNHNYNSLDLKSIPYDETYILKPVHIKENVWIGSNVKITPGVTVGEGVVVGMGAVVTKDIPDFAIVGGNPAKIIKYRDREVYLKLKEENKIYLERKLLGKLSVKGS